MDGIGAAINSGFADAPAELLLVIPGALAVSALMWGAPLAKRFFKRLAG